MEVEDETSTRDDTVAKHADDVRIGLLTAADTLCCARHGKIDPRARVPPVEHPCFLVRRDGEREVAEHEHTDAIVFDRGAGERWVVVVAGGRDVGRQRSHDLGPGGAGQSIQTDDELVEPLVVPFGVRHEEAEMGDDAVAGRDVDTA